VSPSMTTRAASSADMTLLRFTVALHLSGEACHRWREASPENVDNVFRLLYLSLFG
jgi:hypothetical protein